MESWDWVLINFNFLGMVMWPNLHKITYKNKHFQSDSKAKFNTFIEKFEKLIQNHVLITY